MTEVELLSSLLAAEHAAIYGYGVVGARLGQPGRALARAAFDAHRARRDDLAARLLVRRAAPVAPFPSYDVPGQDLGVPVHLEEGLAVRWRALVAGTDDRSLRTLGVGGLQETAVRAAQWRRLAGSAAPTVALPGGR